MSVILSRDALRKAMTVAEMMEQVKLADGGNRDETAELEELKFESPTSAMFRGRPLGLSNTAMSQLGSMFGVRWSKWFGKPGITGEVIQDELKKRLDRSSAQDPIHGPKKFRLRMVNGTSMDILRGVLSPSYIPIDDYPLMQTLTRPALLRMYADTDVRVISSPWSDEYSDSDTNLTLLLNHPIVVKHGDLEDIFYPAIHIANSEVGRRAVTIEDALIRVICVNGMIRVLSRRNLFYQAHRRVDFEDVYEKATEAIREIQRRLPGLQERILGAHNQHIAAADLKERIEEFLKRYQLPLALAEDIQEAFEREPENTLFGLSQAITLAAQKWSPEYATTAERAAATFIN